ncbi:DUF924 family protein [Woeseia oceani]|nr:DUF924 family protein [Woeseia oceani]
MSVKLLSESMDATMTDDDQLRIDRVLSFWFQEQELSAPQIDARMDTWFGENPAFDHEIERVFSGDIERASDGKLQHWAEQPRGRLALIILLDQFRRNIYRGTAKAFDMDKRALKLCVEGAMQNMDKKLTPIERVFFYMPLQHAESRRVQEKSIQIYQRLAKSVSATYRETFETILQFAELHRDIIAQYGRFPHRNQLLGRPNTKEEDEYLSGEDTPDFGQS